MCDIRYVSYTNVVFITCLHNIKFYSYSILPNIVFQQCILIEDYDKVVFLINIIIRISIFILTS